MPTYTSGNGAFTPSLSSDIWVWDTQSSGQFGKIVAIGWGGSEVTSSAYRTRWTRPSTAALGTFTALTSAFHSPNFITFGTRVGTFNTVSLQASDPAGNLWAQNWNGQGGVGMIVMPLANPWWAVNGILQSQIICKTITGVGGSTTSYEVTVEE